MRVMNRAFINYYEGNTGNWYFTGQFPTPGGMRVMNRAFINYYEGNTDRSY
jgi:amidophosphoribosyltransferase